MAESHGATASGQSRATCNGHTDQRTGQGSSGTSGRDECLHVYITWQPRVVHGGKRAGTASCGQTPVVVTSARGAGWCGGGGGVGGGGTGGGGGGGGGPSLPHSGWTSFNSDVSNLTSGSNHSASSVEWLLHERQVDPEQVLLNLGFGGTLLNAAPTVMYARIPDRFLHTESAEAAALEDEVMLPPEGAPPESATAVRVPPSRAMSAWTRARSMSSALLGLKLLTSMQHGAPIFPPPLVGPPSSLPGSSPSHTPPGRARSVLHPENQRALARQGFYGDQLPEGLEVDLDLDREQMSGRKPSAEDRRKQFHKTRSKRQHSLVEESEEGGDAHSRDSHMKSVDFSTTTESTDSGGELSTSAPTTPGDVFLDRVPSPLLGAVFPPSAAAGGDHRLHDLDDLFLPHPYPRSHSNSRQSDSDVTPCASRQPTMEKAPTLTPSQGEEEGGRGDGEEEEAGGGGGRGRGGSATTTKANTAGTAAGSRKTVSIVVSEDDVRRHHVTSSSSSSLASPPPSTTTRGGGRAGTGGGGGMNFLNIVQAAVDRLSDSGSEHTVVDQQSSSSSGSPRPNTGPESPRLGPVVRDRRGDGSDAAAGGGGGGGAPRTPVTTSSSMTSSEGGEVGAATRQLEPGPVLYVSPRTGPHPHPHSYARDENDNLPGQYIPKQGHNLHPHLSGRLGQDDDLPRMSSVQSDSSGFVDTEISNDSAVPDMASLKVSNLGSSCESSATMASSVTVVGSSNNMNNSYNNYSNNQRHTNGALFQDSPDSHKRRSRSADDILQSAGPSPSADADTSRGTSSTGGSRRFITMCYIPHLHKPGSAQIPISTIRNMLTSSSSSSSHHNDGRRSPRGPAHISVVLRSKEGQLVRKEVVTNELPLSEELARAHGQTPAPSTRRAHAPAPAPSLSSARSPQVPPLPTATSTLPRVTLQRPTVDSSSVDGSRGSGDELEREDRSLSYASWSRSELSSGPSQRSSRRPRPRHQYPGTDEESGASLEGSSVYSCASGTSDSIASGGGGGGALPMLDYHKLIKLINQPTVFRGHRARLVQYRPRRQLRDWPGLAKKKRLQEESRLAQHALHKFRSELNMMETAFMGRYHLASELLTPEERDDVEELQHLWAEVRHQALETEQLLTSRMKSLASGNDNFNFLSSINVMQRLIDVLKEQHFHKQLGMDAEEEEEEAQAAEEEEDELEWEAVRRGGGRFRSWGSTSRYASSLGSWGELPRHYASSSPSPRLRTRYSSSTSHIPLSPAFSDSSYDQLRTSLVSEMREEMRSNLHTLHQDLQKRDQEIHRLQLQLMMEGRSKSPRSTQQWTRSLSSSSRQRDVKETDV
ncbi:uncharacterized protein LOC143286819 [Babylonia areolata]|uniref:uncharacterized protein LOC143286819 n=1 Tax=Babylonia areolata TaxID=304850 RepID=UPI003FD15B78